MHFLNPIALMGLLAAAVPVAIHLLHRGRSRPVPFSNLELLRALHQRRMRRLQVRQWLILLLRTMAVILIVLAFSRPAVRDAGGGLFGGSVRVNAVLLIDRSFSTRYEAAGQRTYDRLEGLAVDLLDLFDDGDEVVVLPFDSAPRSPLRNPGRDEVAELSPSSDATRLGAALQAAGALLTSAPAGRRLELFVLSDLTRYGWPTQLPADSRGWLPEVQVYLPAPNPREPANLSVVDVRMDSWLQAQGQRLDLRAWVANCGDQPARVDAGLYVDGQRVQHRVLQVGPHARAPVDLSLSPRRKGHLPGYVEIEGDDLPLDDRRHFLLHIPDRIRVLVLGPDPTDTYFVRTALAAAAGADPALESRAGLLSDLFGADLAGTVLDSLDVLYLCNLSRLDREQTRLVHGFVARGGGLVLFPGPEADLSYYNRQLLPGLLAATLVEVMGAPGAARISARLNLSGQRHPILTGLATDTPPGFRALFRLVPTRPLAPLLQTSDGRLVAVEGWLRAGRVTLFAVPLDLTWSDLPLDGRFAPLMHRLARRSVLPPGHGHAYTVGDPVRRHVPGVAAEDALQVESPSGRRRYLEPQHLDGRLYWAIDALDEPGIWRLRRGEEVVDLFAVNLDGGESDLRRADVGTVESFFGVNRVQWLAAGEDLAESIGATRYGRELWRELLLAAVALLLLELWLARAPASPADPQ